VILCNISRMISTLSFLLLIEEFYRADNFLLNNNENPIVNYIDGDETVMDNHYPDLSCLGIIPARGGSKRIPKKNIFPLLGKPLIYYTIHAAHQSRFLKRLIVSSDDDEILAISRRFGAETPFVRPDHLSGDDIPTVDVLLHALEFLKKEENYSPDIVVILEPTSPLRRTEDIDRGLMIHTKTGTDTVVSVVKTDHCHPMKAKTITNGLLVDYYQKETEGTPRQDLPPVYFRNGAFYSIKRDYLMKNRKLYGGKVVPFEMPVERSVDINSLYDMKIAECFLKEIL